MDASHLTRLSSCLRQNVRALPLKSESLPLEGEIYTAPPTEMGSLDDTSPPTRVVLRTECITGCPMIIQPLHEIPPCEVAPGAGRILYYELTRGFAVVFMAP